MLIDNVSAIELVYENVEGINIPKEYILSFVLDGLEVYTHGLPKVQSDWMFKTGFLQVLISNEINHSDILFDFDDISTEEELSVPLTERIKKRNDLVAVALVNEQGDRQTIYVEWGGDKDYINDASNNKINSSDDVLVSYVKEDLHEEEGIVIGLFQDEFTMDIMRRNKELEKRLNQANKSKKE